MTHEADWLERSAANGDGVVVLGKRRPKASVTHPALAIKGPLMIWTSS